MNLFEQYSYCDAHYEHPQTRRRAPWVRVLATDLQKTVIEPSRNSNCFASVQRYKDATSVRELAKQSSSSVDKRDITEADKFLDQQPHYHGLYFDFDAKPEKDEPEVLALDRARADTMAVARFFIDRFELNPAHVQAWFSGKKGFHLIVRPEPFDIRPHRHLTYMVQKVALDLFHQLDVKTLDRSVYTVSRMWRLANSVHHTTGRFKVELSIRELNELTVEKILDISRSPRVRLESDHCPSVPVSDLYEPEEYDNIVHRPEAVAWWREYIDQYEAAKEMKNLRPKLPVVRPEDGAEYPVCMQDVMDHGPKPGGGARNRLLLPMVAFWKDAGLDKDEAHRLVSDWTKTHFTEPTEANSRIANGKSVVESVYRGEQYHFSCASILSNKGPGPDGRIACSAPRCSWVKNQSDQEPVEVPNVPLWEATRGCYVGKKVRSAVHVSGIAGHPFGIPIKGRALCRPDHDAEICQNCPMKEADGELQFSLAAEDREVLQLIDVNDNRKKGTLKNKLGIPVKCFKHRFEIPEVGNVEEVQIIPMVDSRVFSDDEIGSSDEDIGRRVARHVVRRGFYIGHGIQANRKYTIEAYVYEHPEDQRIVFLWEKMEPAQNDIDSYRMTPVLREKLKIFQPAPGQSIKQKLEDLHTDLEANVHQIRGRFDLAISIMLAYHSVISFNFQNKLVSKGWFELLVMGDSGTGKTTLIERMMAHYGLGELIAGEESKRTGLVFASIQLGGQWILVWGKIPQNDRRLLAIDEFAAIPPEEVGKMTQLRSEGKARGQGVNAGQETWARTRLIFLTNPRTGRQLTEYNYGIEAVRDLFEEHQDLRRVDLAMTVRADDVHRSVVNQRWDAVKVAHKYTADLCQNLVLWAWSREQEHVSFSDDAENRVLYWAERLGDTYECDVPLAAHMDLRYKLARIAAACAALVFSTDDEARKLYVLPEHVDFAADHMDRCYRKKSMAFFEYAKGYKQDNTFTVERKKRVREGLTSFPNADHMLGAMLRSSYLAKGELQDMTGHDRDDNDRLWKLLISNQLIRKHGKGYRKTPAFTELLKELGSVTAGYEGSEFHSTQQQQIVTESQPQPQSQSPPQPRKRTELEGIAEFGEDPPF